MKPPKGRLKQAVSQWCYENIPLDDLCREVAAIGIKGIDLLSKGQWHIPAKHGLTCSMCNGPGDIPKGWNRTEHHDELVKGSEELMPAIAELGLPNMVVFSGNREGQSDAQGLKNCAKGFKRITPLAEELGVTLCIELLNSKRDHPGYQCDNTTWGVELVKRVASQRFKLLYDIYHMQIMEGDIIATLQENIDHIAHIHTGGVPGRNEIDNSQELNYRQIMKAIAETNYQGYIAHEFVPKQDPLTSLKNAVELCTV